ncbi:MAG TPA: retroviral-like aspartic protease family protein [Roseiarcus sp.]|nr:retroviral-like aspartic protease family protein [Roseiarcus sp.]
MKALLGLHPARIRGHMGASLTVFLAVFSLGAGANAAAICGPARVDVGDPGRNGVVSTYVAHDRNGTWTIRHTLVNGMVIDRSLQYAITDYTSRNALQWRGTLMRNPSMVMVGEAMKLTATGQPTYNEWLYQNGQLIMHSVALCRFDAPPATVAEPSVSAPTPRAAAPVTTPISAPVTPATAATAPSRAGEDSVGIVNLGKAVFAQVTLGDQPVLMQIDTGATTMLITQSTAEKLLSSGEADAGPDATYTMADGRTANARQVIIHEVRIGSHVLDNVIAGVGPDNAMTLLPFSVLNRVGRFTIDTTDNKLIFG